jgi:hypothetical protein
MLTQVWSSTICFSVASVATYSPSFFNMFRVLLLSVVCLTFFFLLASLFIHNFKWISSSCPHSQPGALIQFCSAKLEKLLKQGEEKNSFPSLRGQENHYQSPSISKHFLNFLWMPNNRGKEIKFPVRLCSTGMKSIFLLAFDMTSSSIET